MQFHVICNITHEINCPVANNTYISYVKPIRDSRIEKGDLSFKEIYARKWLVFANIPAVTPRTLD